MLSLLQCKALKKLEAVSLPFLWYCHIRFVDCPCVNSLTWLIYASSTLILLIFSWPYFAMSSMIFGGYSSTSIDKSSLLSSESDKVYNATAGVLLSLRSLTMSFSNCFLLMAVGFSGKYPESSDGLAWSGTSMSVLSYKEIISCESAWMIYLFHYK